MLWLSLGSQAIAEPLEGFASASVGELQYRDLWVGDPILGGFTARSSPFFTDTLLVQGTAEVTWRKDSHHRLRIRPSTRTMRFETVLSGDGSLGHAVTSDGLPLDLAVRERLMLDEASYRWRPRGDRSIAVEAGLLPFQIAGGRLLAETWPSLAASVALAPLGGPPVEASLRAAIPTTGGVAQAAAKVAIARSSFEEIALEIAVHDDSAGLTPLLLADPGLLLSVFGRANEPFLERNAREVAAFISDRYLADPYGIDYFLSDAATYLDLGGRGRLWYASLLGSRQVGPLSLDGALILSSGRGFVEGNRVPDGSTWVTPPEDWAIRAPKERWTHEWRILAFASDLDVYLRLPRGPLGDGFAEVFWQMASGDPDLVATSASGGTVRAFIAPDQRFLRTRVFPVDAASIGSGLALPPGVASSGLVAAGAAAGVVGEHGGARLQFAVPFAWTGGCTSCLSGSQRRRYGEEIDLLSWAKVGPLRPSVEWGLFFPGPFFLDPSDPQRDSVGDMPIGWRLFAGVGASIGDAP